MIKISKTDEPYLYINLHGFKDKAHQEEIFEKIKELVEDENK